MMYQCKLNQGSEYTTAWIDERGAARGARVEVPDLGGLWYVCEVYRPGLDGKYLKEKQARDRNCLPSIT